jgi:MFS family permease
MTVTPNELSYIYAGRVLTGIGCGAVTATVPSYIAELSISSIRGILTGLFELAYQTGSLIGFWINFGINQNMSTNSAASWRLPMGFQLVPAVPLLIGGFFIHESPLWLMRKGKEDKATKALVELRKLPADHECKFTPQTLWSLGRILTGFTDVQEELVMLRARLEEEAAVASGYGSGSYALFRGAMHEFAQKGMRIRVVVITCAFTLQNLSGAAGKQCS